MFNFIHRWFKVFAQIFGRFFLLLFKVTGLSNWILRLFIVCFVFISPLFLFSQSEYCVPETPYFEVDLTHDPEAEWTSEGLFHPEGPCCDYGENWNCMEFVVTLHPDANSIIIMFGGPTGNLWLHVECGPAIEVDEPYFLLCFDHEGPHSIVLCRPGTPVPYEFKIISQIFDFNVGLEPFDPVCEDSPPFLLTGGTPPGGVYYVEGEEKVFFDPGEYGPGDYEVVYMVYDEESGCLGTASEILTVIELPEVFWDGMELCDYGGLKELYGGMPEGGYYTGNYVVDNLYFDLDAAPPGEHVVIYHYSDEYGCSGSDTAMVIVHELPIADAGDDRVIVYGTTTLLEAADGGPGEHAYHWEPENLVEEPDEQVTLTVPLFESVVFTLTVTDLETGCINTDQVTVYVTGDTLKIIDITADPDAICFGDSTQLWVLPSGGSGDYNYLWTADPPDPSLVPNDIQSPVVSPDVTTIYTVEVGDNEYPELGTVDSSVVVTVFPLPEVTLNLPESSVCANTPNYALTGGEPEGGTYYLMDEDFNILYLPHIDFSDFCPCEIGEGNYYVLYEYTDPATGCTDFDIAPWEILPYVEALFYVYVEDICQSNVVTISNHSIGADEYFWDFGDGTQSDTDEEVFIHIYPEEDETITYTISLTAINNEGCEHTFEREVTVYPNIYAAFDMDVSEGCAPLTVEFENLSTGPIEYYLWIFGDGTLSMEENPVKTFHNYYDTDTVYTVELIVGSDNFFCTDSYFADITVYPYVEAGFAIDPVDACSPYHAEIMNNAINAEFYEWDFGDGSPVSNSGEDIIEHTYENPGPDVEVYNLKQTVWIERNGEEVCIKEFDKDITVYPEVEAAFTVSDDEGCAPFTVEFYNNSVNATNFLWDFGDGGTSSQSDPEHIFHNTTGETIEYEVEMIAWSDYSCYDTTGIIITVHPQVTAGFDFSPAYACNPHYAEFTNTSTSGSVMTYYWDFGYGDPSTQENPDPHLYDHDEDEPQTYEIVLTVTTEEGCQDVAIDSITIYPKVIADFQPIPGSGCSPLEVFFQNNSTGGLNYEWHFGDGEASSTEFEPTHVYENPGYDNIEYFDATLVVESEYLCYDTIIHTIEVLPTPKADFTVELASGCSPFTATIINNSKGVDTYYWDFGDGSGIHNFDDDIFEWEFENDTGDPISYTIHLEVENYFGCTSELSRKITVYPEVIAGFEDVEDGCHPHMVNFVNTTQNALYYEWDFGDGTTSQEEHPEHTYINFSPTEEATFTASLFAESGFGCWDIYEQEDITVFPTPLASFWVENPVGCSPHEVIIHNASEGGSEFWWDIGDGTPPFEDGSDVISVTYYVEPGEGEQVYNIKLEVINDYGCTDVFTQQVTIYPDVIADFYVSEDEGCHPFTVDFTNESQGASGHTPYKWDYGDGNTSYNSEYIHSHTFHNYSHTDDTTYTVTLVASYENVCFDTLQRDIDVLATPLVDFEVLNSPGCSPHEIIVENNSVGGVNFLWDFGDGSDPVNQEHPDPHQYTQPAGEGPGIFTITLEVWGENDCYHFYQQDVTIYPEIEAMFDMNGEGCHPLTVQFENQTVGGHSYLWDFGDGNQSKEENPEHLFYNYSHTEVQERIVTLYAMSDYGCEAQYSDTVYIWPTPKASFNLSETSGCSPFSPTIYNNSVGNDLIYEWDFGNGQSNEDAPSFVHTWENTTDNPLDFQILLTVINEFGCSDNTSESITVFPEVIADFTTSDGFFDGCSPFMVKFVNQSHLGNTYKWDFDDGTTSTSANPTHIFINDRPDIEVFNVSLEATSVYYCKDTVIRDVSVYPAPEANFTALPEVQPYPETTVTITNHTNPGDFMFQWDFGDGSDIYETEDRTPFDYTYEWDEGDLTTKTYIITLTASNDYCYDGKEQQVTITSPFPVADFEPSTQGCVPFEVQFYNNSLYSNEYRWHFGDGVISVEENPKHEFIDAGEYEVMLIAIGDGGRDTTYRLVTVFENPLADFELVSNLILIPHESLEVINKSELASYYFWEFGDGGTSTEFEPVYYYDTPGVYDVLLTAYTDTDPQCIDTKILEAGLRVDEACQVLFPNAFKPITTGPTGGTYDPSNPNAVFLPLYEGVDEEKYVLEIYNRWGELIFRSTHPDIGWDGYFRGKLASMDVYVWKVSGKCTNGRIINKSGDVTLIR